MAPTQNLKPLACLLLALGLLATWRWWVASDLPLSVDEAYYFAWSRTPDWGYWTKPPLIAWAIGAADALCGPATACVRSVGVLAFSATSLLIYALARQMALGNGYALAASLAFATLPLATFYGLAASTDSLLLLCWVMAMTSLWAALHDRAWGWVGLGLSAGLGLLAKYSMAVLGPSVALALLHPQWRHHWKHPGPYVAAAVALIVFAPNLWWNFNNGMPTLQHTADISRGASYALNIERMMGFWAEQWVVGNVVLVSVYAYWLLRGSGRTEPKGWFWMSLSLPMLTVISAQAMLSRAHANWAAPAHAAMVMAAIHLLWQHRRHTGLKVAIALNLLFAVLLYHGQTLVREPLGLAAGWRTDPYWALRNWPGVHQQARELLQARLPANQWRVAADDRAVLAQLQWGLNLPAGAALGWKKSGQAMNHFDQRFPLTPESPAILLLTRSSDAEVMQQFPQAQRAGTLRSAVVESEAIVLNTWWLNLP
ncbi:MAG: glycosyltransferase family 39 protein [Alphaproteobacteria bacterium]|nr:glycosyltransferase family 39 protein [Alphaproteobacteria bacterium]